MTSEDPKPPEPEGSIQSPDKDEQSEPASPIPTVSQSSPSSSQTLRNRIHLYFSGRTFSDWVQLIGLGVLTVYTTFAALQWYEMKKATNATKIAADAAKQSADLSQQLTESQNAAVIMPGFSVKGNQYFEISLFNRGKASASRISGRIILSRHSLPSLKKLSGPQMFPIDTIPLLRPEDARSFDFSIPGFGDTTLKSFWTQHEAIRVELTWQYDNGFNHVVTNSVCYFHYAEVGGVDNNCPCQGMSALLAERSFQLKHKTQK